MSQPTTVLYIACSLDGKIARLDGSLDWLFAVAGNGDNGYEAFYDRVGAVIMGRKTYDEVLQLSETYPYTDIPSYIYSRTPRTSESVTFTDEPLDQLLERITPTIEGNVWLIGGGELIQEALRLQCVSSIELAIAPVILGTGIPLFPEGTVETKLRLKESRHSGQFLMATYEVLT